MNFRSKTMLKLREFLKRYYIILIIIAVALCIMLYVNRSFKKPQKEESVSKSNSISSPVIDTTKEVPTEYKEPINNLIKNFMEYCNNKEYESGYNLLSSDFKKRYISSLSKFKIYVDTVFKSKKIYNVQNYSNTNEIYVYSITIMDDILASGSTNGYNSIEDKFVITKENGEFKLALNGYCGSKEINVNSQDKYMEIRIVKKYIKYDKETYLIQFKNMTNNYIVLADNTEKNEIILKTSSGSKQCDMTNANLVILPNETVEKEITFDKYFDDGKEDENLILNAIRILPEYSGKEENATKEKKKAVKLYSLTIDLKQNKQ
ncbi:MAG TPA: hypothetical protein OIM45_06260 [Clostridiaceae bacterium]|nr:hypothetical protein [Clostridiaceae bacterium]